ncbi:NXPE family member 3-like [Saccoglossus kowalevskii]|uniref:NXPE family member 3-like n=1 Tax=Saccoglossus kowalevskii TaxID=10224 RepID=A0ABM0M9H1_SACKO|nr:PREDICTED: NXPE family member 3-like [Saccoglossus kowalevskii]
MVCSLSTDSSFGLQSLLSEIPICSDGLYMDEFKPTGFWNHNTWHSLVCQTTRFDRQSSRVCLNEYSELYFLGDSTSRQWFIELYQLLGIPSDNVTWDEHYKNTPKKIQKFLYKKTRGKAIIDGMTLFFLFHPLASTKQKLSLEHFPLEYEILENIQTCDTVIVLGTWAHYTRWTVTAFDERLRYIKQHLYEYKKRCPGSKIIIRGSHAREHDGWEKNLGNSDFLLRGVNDILKNVFESELSLTFIDVWELNYSSFAKQTVHMPEHVVKEEINLLLSNVCPEKYY